MACMAENEVDPPVLGVAWDGTGYGPDGTIWGGEFFLVSAGGVRAGGRAASLPAAGRRSGRPGAAPQRVGPALRVRRRPSGGRRLGWTCRELAEAPFDEPERRVLAQMLARGVNAPRTSSVGRLFDAVASLAGVRHTVRFEGQAAMELEFAAGLAGATRRTSSCWSIGTSSGLRTSKGQILVPIRIVDWSPMVEALLDDVRAGRPAAEMAAKFHNGLAEAVVAVARAGPGSRGWRCPAGASRTATSPSASSTRLRGRGLQALLAPADPAQRRRHLARTGGRGGEGNRTENWGMSQTIC